MYNRYMKHAKKIFWSRRDRAYSRGIDWQLTFDEWYNWYLSHGVDMDQRRTHSAMILCMCRYNDQGPYSLSNIYCATNSQNMKDSHTQGGSVKLKRSIQTPYGVFTGINHAMRVLKVDVYYRMKRQPSEWYYL